MKRHNYVVAGNKPWNRLTYDTIIRRFPGKWWFCADPAALARTVSRCHPRFIFFLHWSHWVPPSLTDRYDCVCFHMTDVPYGRGGTPLQNLIWRGHTRTKLSALRMVSEMDAGPVYLKRSLSLQGTAEEIFQRATVLSARMIRRIISGSILPRPQSGRVVRFRRRTPAQSEIPPRLSSRRLFDFIRMLDAPTYPRAFLRHQGWRYEFSGAGRDGKDLVALVRILKEKRHG